MSLTIVLWLGLPLPDNPITMHEPTFMHVTAE
jgi:hypothetical protein